MSCTSDYQQWQEWPVARVYHLVHLRPKNRLNRRRCRWNRLTKRVDLHRDDDLRKYCSASPGTAAIPISRSPGKATSGVSKACTTAATSCSSSRGSIRRPNSRCQPPSSLPLTSFGTAPAPRSSALVTSSPAALPAQSPSIAPACPTRRLIAPIPAADSFP